jgi:hypothetical protein
MASPRQRATQLPGFRDRGLDIKGRRTALKMVGSATHTAPGVAR